MRTTTWPALALALAIPSAAIAQDEPTHALDALRGVPGSNPLTIRAEPKFTDGTSKDHWMGDVEALLVAKVRQMPPPAGVRAGTKIALCFKTDDKGVPFAQRVCGGSRDRRLETFVRGALTAAAPFPAPPKDDVSRELNWVYSARR